MLFQLLRAALQSSKLHVLPIYFLPAQPFSKVQEAMRKIMSFSWVWLGQLYWKWTVRISRSYMGFSVLHIHSTKGITEMMWSCHIREWSLFTAGGGGIQKIARTQNVPPPSTTPLNGIHWIPHRQSMCMKMQKSHYVWKVHILSTFFLWERRRHKPVMRT